MRRIAILILIMFVCGIAMAQTQQIGTKNGTVQILGRGIVDTTFRLPLDTLHGAIGTFAYKDGSLYYNNGLQWQQIVINNNDNNATYYIVTNVVASPPISPGIGDTYLVGISPSGGFVGHANQIAVWDGVQWVYTDPQTGDYVYNVFNALTYRYDGTKWVIVPGIPAFVNGNNISSDFSLGNRLNYTLKFMTNNIIRGGFTNTGYFFLNKIDATTSSTDSALIINRTNNHIELAAFQKKKNTDTTHNFILSGPVLSLNTSTNLQEDAALFTIGGNTVFHIYREDTSASHFSNVTRVMSRMSYDGGLTWQSSRLVFDSINVQDRNIIGYSYGSGNIVAIFKSGNTIKRVLSSDTGATWSTTKTVPTDLGTGAMPVGTMWKDGIYSYALMYILNKVQVMRSTDNGDNWSIYSTPIDSTANASFSLAEVWFGFKSNGRGVLLGRDNNYQRSGAFYQWNTTDNLNTVTYLGRSNIGAVGMTRTSPYISYYPQTDELLAAWSQRSADTITGVQGYETTQASPSDSTVLFKQKFEIAFSSATSWQRFASFRRPAPDWNVQYGNYNSTILSDGRLLFVGGDANHQIGQPYSAQYTAFYQFDLTYTARGNQNDSGINRYSNMVRVYNYYTGMNDYLRSLRGIEWSDMDSLNHPAHSGGYKINSYSDTKPLMSLHNKVDNQIFGFYPTGKALFNPLQFTENSDSTQFGGTMTANKRGDFKDSLIVRGSFNLPNLPATYLTYINATKSLRPTNQLFWDSTSQNLVFQTSNFGRFYIQSANQSSGAVELRLSVKASAIDSGISIIMQKTGTTSNYGASQFFIRHNQFTGTVGQNYYSWFYNLDTNYVQTRLRIGAPKWLELGAGYAAAISGATTPFPTLRLIASGTAGVAGYNILASTAADTTAHGTALTQSNGDITSYVDSTWSLGSSVYRWKNLYTALPSYSSGSYGVVVENFTNKRLEQTPLIQGNGISISTNGSGITIAQNTIVQALTDGAIITWNLNNGFNSSVTLGGNRTLSITNPVTGTYGTIVITQDATGSRTLTLPANSKVVAFWGSSTTINLSTTPGAIDIANFYYDGTTYFWTLGKNYQ